MPYCSFSKTKRKYFLPNISDVVNGWALYSDMFWFEKRQDLITSSWRGSWLGNPGSCFVMWLHSVCYCVSYDDSIIILGNFFSKMQSTGRPMLCRYYASMGKSAENRGLRDQKSICGTRFTFIHKTTTCFRKAVCSAEKPMWREIHFAFWLPFTNFHFINFVVVTNHRKSNNIYNVLYYLLMCVPMLLFFL